MADSCIFSAPILVAHADPSSFVEFPLPSSYSFIATWQPATQSRPNT